MVRVKEFTRFVINAAIDRYKRTVPARPYLLSAKYNYIAMHYTLNITLSDTRVTIRVRLMHLTGHMPHTSLIEHTRTNMGPTAEVVVITVIIIIIY